MSDQATSNSNVTSSKDAFLVINQIPSTQSLQIQNTNKEYPIQLRVDPVTDYTALGITVFVSIITALISASITIFVVGKSNKNLIENENNLQRNALAHDKIQEIAKLTSKNQQEWINSLRTDIAEIISKTSNIIHNLRATLQITNKQHTERSDLDFSIFISSYQEVDSLISKVELFLDEENLFQKELIDEISNLKSNLLEFCNINLYPDELFYNKTDRIVNLKSNLSGNISQVLYLVKTIIKHEWKKTLRGE
ncbi:hypothetical protein D3C78_97120 [compost metagenome]